MNDGERPHLVRAREWTDLPLAPGGRSLVEASAGTGKTWTIAVLYLRLLLEPWGVSGQPLRARDIVVGTFTDAAAQELHARIRSRLLWAEVLAAKAVRDGGLTTCDDAPFEEAWLCARWNVDATQARRDQRRLRVALAELDRAPITTLHGLCRRILADFPFECASAFRLGDLVSGDAMLEGLAEDLWRRLQQGSEEPPQFESTATMEALRKRLGRCLEPGVGLWVPNDAELSRVLPTGMADGLRALAKRDRIWSSTPTGRQSTALRGALAAFADWLDGKRESLTDRQLEHLGNPGTLLNPAQADALLAQPPLRDLPNVLRCYGYMHHAAEIAAWREWTLDVRRRRDEQLAAANRLTYDDLLTRVHAALERDANGLADRLFAEWKIALIDEFQDTDALQYAILDRIYRDTTGEPRGRLVLIGDPKQAIYRFRGGDIDSYLAAAARVDSMLALGTNRRSSRAYVAALNEWFERAGPLLSADASHAISVPPVVASDRRDAAVYETPDDEAARPLVVHYNERVPTEARRRKELALGACANRIAAMLDDSRYRIAGKPVAPGDIAVLLPTNPQVGRMRELLQQRGVPCVGSGRSSVFDTEWARELQIVLYAVEHATEEGVLRAALATRLGGLDYGALGRLRADPEASQEHADRYAKLKRTWQREGVLRVVLEFARTAMSQMPTPAQRERAMTDLRHLGELLQAQAENVHGAEPLLAWLAEQREDRRDDVADASDERQLRVESDAKRVRLMTLHASKGLEFPIVFLPLMWCHRQHGQDKTPVIHEPLCDRRIIGFGAQAVAQHRNDDQNERFRVLYVALTRAIHACHVYALSPTRRRDARRNSSPERDPARSALDAMIERLLARGPETQPFRHLQWMAAPWDQSRRHYTQSRSSPPRRFEALREPAATPFEHRWSFSSLIGTHRPALLEEEPADDEGAPDIPALQDSESSIERSALDAPVVVAVTGNADTIERSNAASADPSRSEVSGPDPALLELSGLRGREFGNAVHEILERRDAGTSLLEQRELVEQSLRTNAVRLGDLAMGNAISRIARRLDAMLATEIARGLRLSAIPSRSQRAEMEFCFVLDAVSVERIRAACVRHGDPALVPEQIPAMRLRGLMTGKIDLVFENSGRFHVLDYKGNHLGDRLPAYMPAALENAMNVHDYRFQALLYSVAVDRYLRQRIPGYQRATQLGEAIYLFVRAVGIAPAAGVWTHRFDDGLITAVDVALGAGSHIEAPA
ncbi:MAG: UvrD-helicase domain-containing protein [Rhodanobacteraceae bacterium]